MLSLYADFLQQAKSKRVKYYLQDSTCINHNYLQFKWDLFFNTVLCIQDFTTPQLQLRILRNNRTRIQQFCNNNKLHIIITQLTKYKDYDFIGLKFNSTQSKTWFLLKYSELIQECLLKDESIF